MSWTCCDVKEPVMRPSSLIFVSMRAAEDTRRSSTIASSRPMFSPVALPNLRAPSLVSEKLTAGRLFSSIVGLALRRSCPVTAATFLTR